MHEGQAHAVDAEDVAAVDHVDPRLAHEVLEAAGLVVVEGGQQVDADAGGGQRRDESDQLVELLLGPGDQQHHAHADERQEHGEAERPVVVGDGNHRLFPLLLDDDHEDQDGDAGGREEQRTVLLDLAGLDGAQAAAALFGEEAGAVDGAVDDGLVDVLVDPVACPLGRRCRRR